ncbi:MAG: DUF1385 domain-containing protein [Clostridia bacterium]|nr:DUF1385 domain-containing protein [Clostridia bacterium]MBQ9924834.1 DUF1385 domain-containing protein [Clostridia bacterium]
MSEIKKRTTIGGQALIEGILMRGPKKTAIVVRKKNGEHVIKEEPVGTNSHAAFWKLPFIRGAVNLWDSMKYGVSALEYSASFFEDDEDYVPSKFENWIYGKFGKQKVDDALMMVAVVIGCLMPVGLFMLLPTILAGLFSFIESNFLKNLLEGCIRIAIFLAFVIITSKQSDVHRTYMYHGAEHKTIFCYEAGLELNVENVRKQSRFHPRCGTSFMFVVVMITTLVMSVFTWKSVWMRLLLRLAMVPVVVGISYEINRAVGRMDNIISKIATAPGLFMQRFTTVEPDDYMIEVAIDAIKRVIPEGEDEDKW